MNKENCKKLIKKVKESPFNWANPKMCLGHYAQELTGNESKVDALRSILEIDYDTAVQLFLGQDKNNKNILPNDKAETWEKWYESNKTIRGHKTAAINYLTSLMED